MLIVMPLKTQRGALETKGLSAARGGGGQPGTLSAGLLALGLMLALRRAVPEQNRFGLRQGTASAQGTCAGTNAPLLLPGVKHSG